MPTFIYQSFINPSLSSILQLTPSVLGASLLTLSFPWSELTLSPPTYPESAPEKLLIKDRLSMKIHKYLSETLPMEKFDKYLKSYRTPDQKMIILPDSYNTKYASKYSSGAAKWDEPDTVYGALSDKKPYSKAITEGGESTSADVEVSEEKKERRKKKKSREPEETKAIEASAAVASEAVAPKADGDSASAAAPAEGGADAAPAGEEEVLDEKERKKLEKKKRKAEREAAAKAAMEAELEALAAAEAELAKLEAESAKAGVDAAAPAPEAAPAADAAPAKCESPVPETEEVEECLQPPLPPSPTPQQEPLYEEEAPLSPSPPQPEPQVEYEPEVVEPEAEPGIPAPAEPEPELEAELLGEAETTQDVIPTYAPQLEALEPSTVIPTEGEEEQLQLQAEDDPGSYLIDETTPAADEYANENYNTTITAEPPLSPSSEALRAPADLPQSPIETVTASQPSFESPPPAVEDDTQFLTADTQGFEVEEEEPFADSAEDYGGTEADQQEPVIEQEVEYTVDTDQPADEEEEDE